MLVEARVAAQRSGMTPVPPRSSGRVNVGADLCVRPGRTHRCAPTRSYRDPLELDALLGADAGLEGMLDLRHLGDQVGGVD